MGNISFYQGWFASALFWLGACISLFGLALLIFPGHAIQLGSRMNRWISTDSFFQKLDKPHYRERLFYRWHHIFGVIIVLASLYIMYMFVFHTDVESVASVFPVFDEQEVNRWLVEAMIYFFIVTSIVILALGVIIIARPSMLKRLEERLNTWVRTDKSFDKLDHRYEIPENILPGNVRLFGTAVLLGGLYIMANIFGVIS